MTSNADTKATIRGAVIQDAPQILALYSGLDAGNRNLKDIEKRLRKKNLVTFVAIVNNKIVGFLLIELNKEHFQIVELYVSPDFQRRRVGAALITHTIEQLAPTRRRRILAVVNENNLTMHLFLRFCKFRCVDIARNHFNSYDAYRFEYRTQWPEKMLSKDKKGYYAPVK
jgi:ribosomal protein S18 acetylase RimI-like enzyme